VTGIGEAVAAYEAATTLVIEEARGLTSPQVERLRAECPLLAAALTVLGETNGALEEATHGHFERVRTKWRATLRTFADTPA
jgi:hypothetical protein